ncbi:hypothetical protein [Bradyrhizobium cosmicum]|uniref:hypothetical protein n=1 Tax=Bradyrhizobium cosmicum TaxID=1404864 RepID=UPI0028EC54BF|nr:hypothetical protein [Bradyrhizobium cosmicum]
MSKWDRSAEASSLGGAGFATGADRGTMRDSLAKRAVCGGFLAIGFLTPPFFVFMGTIFHNPAQV